MIFWGNWSVLLPRYETSHIITFHFLKTSTRSRIKPKIEILVFSTRCIVYRKVYFYCTSYKYTFQDLLYNFSYTTDISNLIFNHNINLYKTPLIIWVSICSGMAPFKVIIFHDIFHDFHDVFCKLIFLMRSYLSF